MAKSPRRDRKPAPLPPKAAQSSPAPPPDAPRPAWLCPALIFVLAILVYAPTLGNGFPYDDRLAIVQNRLIRNLRDVPRMLTSDYWAGVDLPYVLGETRLYRPLVIVSFALNYAVGGLNPIGYHAVNLLLHGAVSLAVYALGRRLLFTRAGATVAAALFAVHPLHTEVVAGIVGRAELLMALGVLLALVGYFQGGMAGRLGSLAAFAMGLLSKEQAAVVPVLLGLYDFYAGRQSVRSPRWTVLARTTSQRLMPYIGVLGAYLWLRAWVLGGAAAPSPSILDNPLVHAPLAPRLLTAMVVAGRYLSLCLWPFPLSPDYSLNQIPLATSPLDARLLLAVLLWGSILFLATRSSRRGNETVGFSVAFILLTFLPAANLLIPIGTIMGERLFYLPSVGLCWLAGLGWQEGLSRINRPALWRSAWAGLCLVLVVFIGQSVRYGRIWRDDRTLFAYAVEVAPRSARAHYVLGNSLLPLRDKKAEAISHLRRATEIYPEYIEAWDGLGRGYSDTGQWAQASAAFRKAISLNPDYPDPYNNLGVVHARQQRWDEAMAAFRQAVTLRPDLAEAHRNLGDIYEYRGWTEAAQAERTLEVQPTDPLAWLRAGSIFLRLGWAEEALGALREAVRRDPTLPEARLALAQAYDTLNRPREAAEAYEAVLRISPQLTDIHRRLAELYTTRLGDPARAEAHRRQAGGGFNGKPTTDNGQPTK